ncbi:hypothetical protein HUU40_00280 [candidate division KSB1 bacterium]|nr:hypothetical protein [candidate division KSB1 bacterium]
MLGFRKAEVDALRREYQNAARLVDISRNGPEVVLTFIRQGEPFTITVQGTWSDDVNAWKRAAGLE